MKLTIGPPIVKSKNPVNTYKIVVETMEGDADDYHTVTKLTTSEEEIKTIMLVLEAIVRVGGQPKDLSEFERPFFDKTLGHDADFICSPSRCWNNSQFDWWDSYQSHRLTYYNNEGVECSVDYSLDKTDVLKMKLEDIAEQANEEEIEDVVIPNYTLLKAFYNKTVVDECCVIANVVIHRNNNDKNNFIVLTNEGSAYNQVSDNYEWEDVVVNEYFSEEELMAHVEEFIPTSDIIDILKQREEVYNAVIWEAIFNE